MVSRLVCTGGALSAAVICPVCGSSGAAADAVVRERLPTMQNYVYRTPEAARAARQARFTLAVCGVCDFAWNRTFDPGLLAYDSGYDNTVSSGVMTAYYEEIARYLGDRYDLARGFVVDIGCGSGTFLKTMARAWPELRGLGVDPVLQGETWHADGRIQLVQGVFSPERLSERPSLFVCRHVMEHIPTPVAFLRELHDAVQGYGTVPLFVEVPDTPWILQNGAFWDFCYEHCNYFSERSLAHALQRAGFVPRATRVAYGEQYRWMEAATGPTLDDGANAGFAEALHTYAQAETGAMEAVRARLSEVRRAGSAVAVWGMATKGVVFSILIDSDNLLFDACVDVNSNKQGCFVPLTARRIDSPTALMAFSGHPLTIVVMNGNYLGEIKESCRRMGVRATFLDANAAEI